MTIFDRIAFPAFVYVVAWFWLVISPPTTWELRCDSEVCGSAPLLARAIAIPPPKDRAWHFFSARYWSRNVEASIDARFRIIEPASVEIDWLDKNVAFPRRSWAYPPTEKRTPFRFVLRNRPPVELVFESDRPLLAP